MGKASRKKRGRPIKGDEDFLREMFARNARLETAFWKGVLLAMRRFRDGYV